MAGDLNMSKVFTWERVGPALDTFDFKASDPRDSFKTTSAQSFFEHSVVPFVAKLLEVVVFKCHI